MRGWAARKAAVAAEDRAAAEAREAARRQAEDAALAEKSDETLLAEAGVAPPEELLSAAEVRDFLGRALPERLKRRALRRLWGLNPVLANVDGLVDYGEDYTDTALAVGDLQTVYAVGRGMLEQFRPPEGDGAARTVSAGEAVDDAGAAAGCERPAAGPAPAATAVGPVVDDAASGADVSEAALFSGSGPGAGPACADVAVLPMSQVQDGAALSLHGAQEDVALRAPLPPGARRMHFRFGS